MEIRLNIWEIAFVIFGLLTSGTITGLIIAAEQTSYFYLVYLFMILIPVFTVIIRKRYKLIK